MFKRIAPLFGTGYHYPTWNRAMEMVGILTYFVFSALLVGRLLVVANAASAPPFWATALGFLPLATLAFAAADFVSGFVHCAADNFGKPTTPLFGVAFIRPFRDHHRDPLDITRHDFVETNGNSCIVNLLVLIPTYFIVTPSAPLLSMFGGGFILTFTLAIVMTNQVHKWAHMEVPPPFIARLQATGLVLSPVNHQIHHTAPFDKFYCITTGWLNTPLEKIGFFARFVRTFK